VNSGENCNREPPFLGWTISGPDQNALGWVWLSQKKIPQKSFQKICDFLAYFSINFA